MKTVPAKLLSLLVCAVALLAAGASSADAQTFAIGNRVWSDINNNGAIDGGEAGIDGVTVNLYAASDLTTILATTTTTGGGYYLFTGLLAGDYVVSVTAGNFTGVGALSGFSSSGTSTSSAGIVSEVSAPPANGDVDSDDNGTKQTAGALNGAVISSTVTVGPAAGSEPTGEADLNGGNQGGPDGDGNMTVDFGFYVVRLQGTVWNDLDNSGVINGGEVGIDGVTVDLFSADQTTQIATATTTGGGFYTFDVPAGDYFVRLPASDFNPAGVLRGFRSSTGPLPTLAYEPAPNPNTNTTDSDDNGTETNGVLGLGGFIETPAAVTLTPAGEASIDAAGRTIESRVDFGVNNTPQLDLVTTNTDNQSTYLPNTTLSYVVVVTNNGPADANGMTVSATRPAQITSWTWTCAAGTPASYNCTNSAGNPATFTDSIDLPQSVSVTYNVTALVSGSPTGSLSMQAVASPPAGMTDTTPTDNSATDTDTIVAVPTMAEWQILTLGLVLVLAGGWLVRRA